MIDTNNNLKYNKLIANKKVVFVGPAPTLIGTGNGKWLDENFDLVVRTNGSILLLNNNRKYCKDYGSRCDVLYSNVQFHREMGPFPLQDWKKNFGLQFLCMKTGARASLTNYNNIVPTRNVIHIVGQLQNKVSGLLMGVIVLEDIIQQRPKSLYVTGMNFFYNKPLKFIPGDYREYYPNYLPDKIRHRADIANIGKKDMHDQFYNTQYIFNMWKKKLIEIDETMQQIMPEILKHPEKYTNKGKYGGK